VAADASSELKQLRVCVSYLCVCVFGQGLNLNTGVSFLITLFIKDRERHIFEPPSRTTSLPNAHRHIYAEHFSCKFLKHIA